MKFGIIIGVLTGVVILGIAAILVVSLVILPAARSIFSQEGNTPTPSIVAAGTTPAKTTPATTGPARTTAPALPAPITPSPGPNSKTTPISPVTNTPKVADVNFSPNITGISENGLTSRTITAELTNTGSADAHNVRAKVEVFSQNARIKINGQDYLEETLGTLKAGATVNIQKTVSVGISDGLKILQNGATVNLTIYSDEKTQSTSYQYGP